nr:MAG TPA: hypothetical protein [Microviridae sp.]
MENNSEHYRRSRIVSTILLYRRLRQHLESIRKHRKCKQQMSK